jgi:hypothetical protein
VLSAYGRSELANSEHSNFRRRAIETRLWWRIGAMIARPERVVELTVGEPTARRRGPRKSAGSTADGWLFHSMHRYSEDFNMALVPDGSAARTCPQVYKKAECKCLLPAREREENLPRLQKCHRSRSR